MFSYKYKETGTLSISMIDEYRNEVDYIDYSIYETTLHIIGIERTPHAKKIQFQYAFWNMYFE